MLVALHHDLEYLTTKYSTHNTHIDDQLRYSALAVATSVGTGLAWLLAL